MGFTALAFIQPETKVSPVQEILGQICVDDWTKLFWCHLDGMTARTSDTVDFQIDDYIFVDGAQPVQEAPAGFMQ